MLRFRGNALVAGSTRYQRREMERAPGGWVGGLGGVAAAESTPFPGAVMPPSSRVALSETFCSYSGYPPIARLVLSLLLTAAARSAKVAKAPGAASRFQPAADHRGDRSMRARPRQPHDSKGLRRDPPSAPTEVLIGRVARGCRRAQALSRQGGVM